MLTSVVSSRHLSSYCLIEIKVTDGETLIFIIFFFYWKTNNLTHKNEVVLTLDLLFQTDDSDM